MMNIFESHEGFSGRFDPDSKGGTLTSLLTLAGDIRLKLGRQGYLLDSYLSLFMEGANAMLAYEAGNDGFERGGELRSLCFDVLDRDGMEKDRPFYDTALNALIGRVDIMRCQERQTRMNLLYASLADEFLPFVVKYFLREAEGRIGNGCDIPKLTDLYQRISDAVGEPLMETLNLRLKQRFLTAPLVPVFVQGATNDLLYCLLHRDSETNKQIFQLLMDRES